MKSPFEEPALSVSKGSERKTEGCNARRGCNFSFFFAAPAAQKAGVLRRLHAPPQSVAPNKSIGALLWLAAFRVIPAGSPSAECGKIGATFGC